LDTVEAEVTFMSGKFDLLGIDYVLGKNQIDVKTEMPNFKDAIDKTGIQFVHQSVVSNKDLAVAAANKLIARLSFDRKNIDCLIVVTQSSERRLPNISAEIQNEIGLKTGVFSMDINQGCSGFVQGMIVAISLLSQFSNVLLITTDTYRDKLNPEDRSTNTLFSDAAAASLIVRGNTFELSIHSHTTDGSKSELLKEQPNSYNGKPELYMSGPDIFLWTRKVVASSINSICEEWAKVNSSNLVIFAHQASKLVIDSLQEKSKNQGDFITNYKKIGNTTSSSIPILISDNWTLFTKNPSLCIGFGVGLSLSAVVIIPTASKGN
jgi:3-oxoacyl-[acyl-carrier-protein] synthase-3